MTLPKEYATLKALAECRQNILMVGPSGCGKTYIAERLSADLGLAFASVSCSAGMSESQLAGWLLPTGEGGRFEYAPSDFVRVYENGGVFLFDEIDSADPNTLTFINAALANGNMHVPQRLGNPVVKRHADCIIMAAANTYGNGADMVYVGRNQLDGATLDRFRAGLVTMDYDDAVEESLVHPCVLAWGRAIRAKIREFGLRRIMSTRVLRDFSVLVEKAGWTKAECEKAYFADWPEDERTRLGDLPWPESKPKPKAKPKPKPEPKDEPRPEKAEPKADEKPEESGNAQGRVTLNVEKNGIEIRFDRKPDQSIIDALKSHKWRWAFKRKCWYKRYCPEDMAWASQLVGGAPEPEEETLEPVETPEAPTEAPAPRQALPWHTVKPPVSFQKRFAG